MEDALPYNNAEQLIYYLRTTHKGTNTEEIRNATEVLYAMSKDLVRFTDSLMYLIMNNENNGKKILFGRESSFAVEIIDNIKTSAAVTLAAFLTDISKGQIILTEQRNYILESVLRAMFSKDVVLSLKVTLQGILDELYQTDSGNQSFF